MIGGIAGTVLAAILYISQMGKNELLLMAY